jgi:hypothetical protein
MGWMLAPGNIATYRPAASPVPNHARHGAAGSGAGEPGAARAWADQVDPPKIVNSLFGDMIQAFRPSADANGLPVRADPGSGAWSFRPR